MVRERRLELLQVALRDPKSRVSTIPPPAHNYSTISNSLMTDATASAAVCSSPPYALTIIGSPHFLFKLIMSRINLPSISSFGLSGFMSTIRVSLNSFAALLIAADGRTCIPYLLFKYAVISTIHSFLMASCFASERPRIHLVYVG